MEKEYAYAFSKIQVRTDKYNSYYLAMLFSISDALGMLVLLTLHTCMTSGVTPWIIKYSRVRMLKFYSHSIPGSGFSTKHTVKVMKDIPLCLPERMPDRENGKL